MVIYLEMIDMQWHTKQKEKAPQRKSSKHASGREKQNVENRAKGGKTMLKTEKQH